MTVRVAALTSGRDVPSSRFRVRQHIEALARQGIEVQEFSPRIEKYAVARVGESRMEFRAKKLFSRLPSVARSWRYDITWLERELIFARYTWERLLKHPLLFDVDDALWLTGPAAAESMAKIAARADVVVAGNAFLAEWFGRFAPRIEVVPTAIDSERFKPALRPRPPGPLVIGWTGLASNYRFLEQLQAPLSRFVGEHDAVLLVVADKPPPIALPDGRLRFVRWSRETEVTALQDCDVGIMPLDTTDWSRGKCSFKMLQCMAVGLPVIATPVGMNAELLAEGNIGLAAQSEGEWLDAFRFLAKERDVARAMGAEGRRLVEERYSIAPISGKLAAIFRSLAELDHSQ
jgi:glycosyltransferase involved in cell wall biosynthesis